VVVIGIGYVLINLIVDVVVGVIDPRTRLVPATA
jgi:ABC-type dipeptide/oligopeptide/nickel transport system permease component